MAGENNVIGLAMQLDVTDLKAGIKEVNKTIKSSKDEFNNATAGMDKWTKSSEGLNAKLKQLGTQLDGQKKIAAGYEAEIERVKNLEGDHSAELEVLKGKLLNAQTAIKKTQSAMSHYEDSLREVTQAEKEENSALGKLQKTIADQKKKQADLTKEYKNAVVQYGKNSKEAKALAKKLNTLSKELKDNENKAEDADKSFEDLGKTIKNVGEKAVEKAVKGFAKIGAAVTGVVGGFLATAETTRELRTNMGKVDTAFKEAGFSAEDAEKTYKDFYGVLGDEGQATEAVSHLAKLAGNQKDLAKWANIATGVYATFGDSLPIEGLTEAANETAKTGELTGGLADALNWAGVSEDDFQKSLDGCNSESERQALITKTLNGLYGDASKRYKETNKDIIANQKAQADLSLAMADIGAQAEPLMTQVKLMGAELLKSLLPVIEKIIPAVKANLPQIIAGVSGLVAVIGAMTAAMYVNKAITTAVTTAQFVATAATKAQTAAQWLLNAAMNANPIGLVVIAIGALVAAFVVLWKKSDAFRNFWIGLWDKIVSVSKTAIDKISKFFSTCWNGIKNVWNKAGSFFSGVYNTIVAAFKVIPETLKKFFSSAWDKIKNAFSKVGDFFGGIFLTIAGVFLAIPETLKALFSKAWDGIKTAFSKVGSFFDGVKDDIVNAFKSMPEKMMNVGKNLVTGLWNGIKNAKDWVLEKINGFTDDVLDGIKNFFGIHSPSKETAEMGEYLAEGLAVGMDDGVKENKNVFQKIFGFLKDLLGDAGEAIINQISKMLGIDFSAGFADGVEEGLEDDKPNIENSIEKALDDTTVPVNVEVDTRTSWQKFIDDCEDALGISENKLRAWSEGAGKYINKIANYMQNAASKLGEFINSLTSYFDQMAEQRMSEIEKELETLHKGTETELADKEKSSNEQMEMLNALYDKQEISDVEYRKRKKAIETELVNFSKNKKDEEAANEKRLIEEKNDLAEKQFKAQKAVSIANAVINGAAAIMKGFADLGPIAGAVAAAVQAGITAAQIATIASQKYVPMLAKGGVVDGATLAMIGENGKEAVMPLENNTGWINELAAKISDIMRRDMLGGVQGGVPAYALAGGATTINNYYNQTINSPKALSRREIYRDSKNLLTLKG